MGTGELVLQFPEESFESIAEYLRMKSEVISFFRAHSAELEAVRAVALEIRECYDRLEPFFHEYTEKICSSCETPCCVNRHGLPDLEDLVLFRAMGVDAPPYDFDVADTDRCQFLCSSGCRLPRHSRSYRCTWYFCDFVLDGFERDDPENFRRFDNYLDRLSLLRRRMLEQFMHLWHRRH